MNTAFTTRITRRIKATAFAALLALGGAAHATAPLSGVWKTQDGDYLLLLRDAAATVVGVQLKPDLSAREVYIGARTANRLVLRGVTTGNEESWTVGDETLVGLGQRLATPQLRATTGSALDGVWRRDDDENSYFVIMDGLAANGGLAVVSELRLGNGSFSNRVHIGKINGNFFSDTQRGLLNLRLKDGKLEAALTQREYNPPEPDTAARSTTSTASATHYTSSRVLTGSEPDQRSTNSVGGTRPETGTGTGTTTEEPKGCAGDFGNMQKQVKDAMLAKLAERNVSPGWITSKELIGEKTVFDGGTVPLYRISYLADARTNIKPTLAANSRPTTIRFSCTNGASSSAFGIDTATVDAACASMWAQGADVNPKDATITILGINAEDISFEVSSDQTTQSAAGGMVDVRSYIRLDADNQFTTTSGHYDTIKATCSQLASNDGAGYTPYPNWRPASTGASSFSGTPEVAFCFDPQRNDAVASVYKAGLYAWDLTGYGGDLQIPMTLGVDLSNPQTLVYNGTTSSGEPVNLRITVPEVSVRSVSKLFDPGTGNIKYRYKDKNVDTWSVNTTVDNVLTYYGAPLQDPKQAIGDGLERELFPMVETTAYDKFAVELAVADPFSGSTEKTMTVAQGLANGVKQMSAVGLGALGIGGFKPVPRPGQETQQEAWSDAKFVSIMPNTFQGTEVCEWVPYDPETGTMAHEECSPVATTSRSNYVTFTIEAPFCGN